MAQITLNSTGVASNGTLALQSNGTTTAITIDASQNVTLAGTLGVTKRATFSAPASFDAIAASKGTVEAHTSYGNALAGNGSSYDLMILNRNGQEAFGVVANTQNVVAAGTLKGTSTISVGAATPSTSGAGITFPATQSASSNANTLDDYEEGNWTPTLGGNTTYSSQSGTYVKIGRLVTLNAYFAVTSIGTGSTTQITGIPFTAATGGSGVLTAEYTVSLATAIVSITAFVSSNQIDIYSRTAAATSASINAIFGNGTGFEFTCTYIATA